jgi:hypothetical protein
VKPPATATLAANFPRSPGKKPIRPTFSAARPNSIENRFY